MGEWSIIHWIVVLVIVLILFGAGRLPEIGEGIGKGIRNFKKAMKETKEIDVTPEKPEEKKMPQEEKTKTPS